MSKKSKCKKPRYFYCDLFGFNIYFFHNYKEADFVDFMVKHYKKAPNVKDANGFSQRTLDNDGFNVFVWTRQGKQSLSCLVHECIHATNMIFQSAGVVLDVSNDELQAYYVQRLFKIATKAKKG